MNQVIMHDDPQVAAFFQDMKHLSVLLDTLESNTRSVLNGESFLTDTELAQRLKLTKRTLQEYRNAGKIPFYQIGGKILYREADIEKLLLENRREAFR